MGSRLKQNPEQTFYWFFEATCPVATDKDPGLLFQFPENFSDEDSCQTLSRFCFPYDIKKVRDRVAVQHFTFVLTDLQGYHRFGFCRLTNYTNSCLCILSYLPWFEVFYKLLNNLADYLSKGQTDEMKSLLTALYQQPIPLTAGSFTLQMGDELLVSTEVSNPFGLPGGQKGVPYFIAPDPHSLPSIPENRNLTELIVAVDVGNLLQLYASMLFERRILIFASKLSTLTSCVHALSAVIYPLHWQHIFIPVLPPHLLDSCSAPMPYLIGVHTSLFEQVRSQGLEEVVILNVDTNTLETPFDDLKRMPSDVMSGLKVCLKRQAVSMGCGVSRAFLKAQALLFGGYRDALQGHKEGEICFCKELFSDHKSSSMKQFRMSAIQLQPFTQFIDNRLDILNKGKEPDDLFEEEIKKLKECGTASGSEKSYHHFFGNLKKGGGALILNMKSKANLRVKGLAKSGLKTLLQHKPHSEDLTLQRGGSVSHRRAQSDCLQNRLPITPHFGISRPLRPVHKARNPRDKDNMKDAINEWDGAVSGAVAEPDAEPHNDDDEEGEVGLLFDPEEEMDLLGEIFDSLSSRSSHERGLLYGTRSLDLLGPDCHDYITKAGTANPSQESLSLSISGSGSLHSWNLETTEELSDLTEDSDWHCLDYGVPEEEGTEDLQPVWETGGQESRQNEHRGVNERELNGTQDGEIDDRNNSTEFEDKQKTEVPEKIEDFEVAVMEMQEEEREIEELDKGINYMTEFVRTEEGKRTEGEDSKEKRGSINDSNPDVEQRGEEDVKTASSGPESLSVAAGHDEKNEEAAGKTEQQIRQTPPPPKVQSAITRFQTQTPSQEIPLKSRTKALTESESPCNALQGRKKAYSLPPCDSSDHKPGAAEEEDARPAIKVSELKKRFEA